MSDTHHLVGVWNPSYEADAMEAHVALLLRFAREFREGARDEDDVYVWWGKVRSPNRQAPLSHLPEILAIDAQLAGGAANTTDDSAEVQLYLTDYRSLYVAHVAGVTADEIVDHPAERAHVPDYYRRAGLSCDCWFQLWDIRRVVQDDTPSVIAELRKLRNTRYHGRPVSLYGGMVDLPLLVTRDDGTRWFDERTRAQLTEGRHWVEFDAERTGAGEMQRELRENRFGPALWSALDPAARAFVATGEHTYRQHGQDAAFDLSAVVVHFAKAFEVQVNLLLRQALVDASDDVRFANLDGQTIDLRDGGPFTLGELAYVIAESRARNGWFKRRLVRGAWFAASLPPILSDLRTHRNEAAHGGRIVHEQVTLLRSRLVGIGCKGDLVDLAQVRVLP